MELMRRMGKFILDTVFPIECLGCKAEGEWLCAACARKIPLEQQDLCFVCKKMSLSGRTCFSCVQEFPLAHVVRFFDYDEPLVRRAITTAKYSFVKNIFDRLAGIAAPHILPKLTTLDLDPRAIVFVPVPLHPRRIRERGFNQSEIIAGHFAKEVGAQLSLELVRRRATIPQADLDESDRARNIRGVFRSSGSISLRGRYVFLVDDVATTGSTLLECGKALYGAGARQVSAMVLAKG